jgi:hypothetical protein
MILITGSNIRVSPEFIRDLISHYGITDKLLTPGLSSVDWAVEDVCIEDGNEVGAFPQEWKNGVNEFKQLAALYANKADKAIVIWDKKDLFCQLVIEELNKYKKPFYEIVFSPIK